MEEDPRYLCGLRLILAGHWFEAHEWIEAVWKQVEGRDKLGYQAVLQMAVSLLQLRRRNFWGALSNLAKVARKLPELGRTFRGVELAAWHEAVGDFYRACQLPERLRRSRAGASQQELAALPPEAEWPQPTLEPGLRRAVGTVHFGQARPELEGLP